MNPRAARIGLVAAFALAVGAVLSSTVTVSHPRARVVCIPWQGSGPDGGQLVAQVDSVLVTTSLLQAFGYSFPDAGPGDSYGVAQVQFYPALLSDGGADESQRVPMPAGLVEVEEGSAHLVGSAKAPSCQVAILLQGDTSPLFQCACAPTAGVCQVYPTDGGVPVAAPLGITLAAGTFPTDAGCVPKPCVELFGDASSMPPACL
jgi:hypothetical protein